MTGFFIIQHWNQNRVIWKSAIQKYDVDQARTQHETIIDIAGQRYYTWDGASWNQIRHQ